MGDNLGTPRDYTQEEYDQAHEASRLREKIASNIASTGLAVLFADVIAQDYIGEVPTKVTAITGGVIAAAGVIKLAFANEPLRRLRRRDPSY